MNERDALLRAVIDDPDDDAPRLVFADWFEERGQPERAEFIRLQIALASMPLEDERRWALRLREKALLGRFAKGWAGPVRRLVKSFTFRRGFVEGVALSAADFLKHGNELFRLAPVRHARLFGASDLLPELARSTALGRLSGLDLRHNAIAPDAFGVFLLSKRLAGLRELGLRGTGLCGDEGVRRLAACPHLKELTALDLGDPRRDFTRNRRWTPPNDDWDEYTRWREDPPIARLSPDALRALAAAPFTRRLTRLSLAGHHPRGDDEVRTELADALIDSGLLARLTELNANHSSLGTARLLRAPEAAGLKVLRLVRGSRSLAPSSARWTRVPDPGPPNLPGLASLELGGQYLSRQPDEQWKKTLPGVLDGVGHLTGLVELSLGGCRGDGDSWKAFCQSSALPNLRALDLGEADVPRRAAEWLIDGPLIGQLRWLSLRGSALTKKSGDALLEILFAAPAAAGLLHLDLGNQGVTDAGVATLLKTRHLSGLVSLGLWRNAITDAGAAALARSKRLEGLQWLDLRANGIGAGVRARLRRKFGAGVRFGPGPTGLPRRRDNPYLDDDLEDFDGDE